jgi:hypothetical protein
VVSGSVQRKIRKSVNGWGLIECRRLRRAAMRMSGELVATAQVEFIVRNHSRNGARGSGSRKLGVNAWYTRNSYALCVAVNLSRYCRQGPGIGSSDKARTVCTCQTFRKSLGTCPPRILHQHRSRPRITIGRDAARNCAAGLRGFPNSDKRRKSAAR